MNQALAHTTLTAHDHSHSFLAMPLEWISLLGMVAIGWLACKWIQRSLKR
ncbi:MAG: hypothetical protein HRU19_16085 [Pseudobacteriovorax sp.]|nr:hypothetical protein [Pseudobacteriovorax sp.]